MVLDVGLIDVEMEQNKKVSIAKMHYILCHLKVYKKYI